MPPTERDRLPDICDVCDEDGLIYVTTGYDVNHGEIEDAAVCPACEGTRNGPLARRCLAAESRAERAEALLVEAAPCVTASTLAPTGGEIWRQRCLLDSRIRSYLAEIDKRGGR